MQYAVYSRLVSAYNSIKADRGAQQYNVRVYKRYARELYNAKQLAVKEFKVTHKQLQKEIQAGKAFSAAFAYEHTRASAAEEEKLIVLDRERKLIQKISVYEQDIGNLQADYNELYKDFGETKRDLKYVEGQYAAKCISEADIINSREAYISKCNAIGEQARNQSHIISDLEDEIFAANQALTAEQQRTAALEAQVAALTAALTAQSQRSLTLTHQLDVARADAAHYKEQATKFEDRWQEAREKVTEVHELIRSQG